MGEVHNFLSIAKITVTSAIRNDWEKYILTEIYKTLKSPISSSNCQISFGRTSCPTCCQFANKAETVLSHSFSVLSTLHRAKYDAPRYSTLNIHACCDPFWFIIPIPSLWQVRNLLEKSLHKKLGPLPLAYLLSPVIWRQLKEGDGEASNGLFYGKPIHVNSWMRIFMGSPSIITLALVFGIANK